MKALEPKLRRLKALDKVEQAVAALHEYVVGGNLEPGTELPSENIMARQLGVSKFSMREALKVAQSQGLIEISRGRRTRVASISVKPATDILNIILRRSEGALLELTEVRKCMECHIARLAAMRAKPHDIEAMAKTIRDMEKGSENLNLCINKDLQFHKIMVRSTKNKVFEIMLGPLTQLLYQSRLETLRFSGVQKAIDEHSRILEAVTRGDPDLAEECMRIHMQTAEDNLTRIKELNVSGTELAAVEQ